MQVQLLWFSVNNLRCKLQPYLALFDSTLSVGVAISNLDVCFQLILAVQKHPILLLNILSLYLFCRVILILYHNH